MTLAENVAAIRRRIAEAAERAGRDPASVTLVAVTKTHPPETIRAAMECGLSDFGENRVEEALPKMAQLPEVRWHMVGHVQSRKAKDVVRAGFVLVHSVDTLKLAERLSRFAQEVGRMQEVLLECNVSGEASKSGFDAQDPAAWPTLLDEFGKIAALPGLRVRGLMTMAPLGTDNVTARPFFRRLRELRDAARERWPQTDWSALSMGMTDDFEGAIAEGATLVRIGRAIFGERAT
ncbi:MAG: YggS family pyridoxal phosphate-dependent enzyme [Anaerolineales bacterium]|nr:YggS family pyridoxal phosphate-dependent enzyme [Anaerolineales bacterium]